jgi:hypothetical protein
MIWHGFGMFGQGGAATDPSESGFSQRVRQLGVNIHGSPYEHYEAGQIAVDIDRLPPEDGAFVFGTSLGCCNVAVVCSRVKHRIDGAFGFQASIYGAVGYPINSNVKFAHLIYSYNPLPLPGLGSYIWPTGTINPASYIKTQHDIPHPGDYDVADQDKFLAEMRGIMQAHQPEN